MAENIFLVKVGSSCAVCTYVNFKGKDMPLTARQRWSSATGGNPMPLNTWDKTQFIQTGWTATVRHKHSVTTKQIEVCRDLSKALCTDVIHTCHRLLESKCPPFCEISGFSLLFIYIQQCWLVAAERFWGLILQVFQRMNALLNAPFTSADDL